MTFFDSSDEKARCQQNEFQFKSCLNDFNCRFLWQISVDNCLQPYLNSNPSLNWASIFAMTVIPSGSKLSNALPITRNSPFSMKFFSIAAINEYGNDASENLTGPIR